MNYKELSAFFPLRTNLLCYSEDKFYSLYVDMHLYTAVNELLNILMSNKLDT